MGQRRTASLGLVPALFLRRTDVFFGSEAGGGYTWGPALQIRVVGPKVRWTAHRKPVPTTRKMTISRCPIGRD